jgi:hypothetical protein
VAEVTQFTPGFIVAMAFNAALALAAFFGSMQLRDIKGRLTSLEENKSTNERLRTLEQADLAMVQAVSKLREELPTNYIRRDDFKAGMDQVFQALRRIEDKLDSKVDKP